MRASVFSLPFATSFNEGDYLLDAVGEVVNGYVRVGRLPESGDLPERWAVMAEPGAPILPEAISVGVDGGVQEWTVEQLVLLKPGEAMYVLEREWEISVGGIAVRGRVKMSEPLPEGSTGSGSNLIPVLFAGDNP